MNSSVSPFSSLSAVIRGLRGSLGGWSVRGLVGVALGLLLYRRLGEIGLRMERMAARFAAGRLWRIGPEVTRAPRVVVAAGGAGRVRIWPRRFGWLVVAAGWQAAGYRSQLLAVLETPEMVALLAAAPEARRVLRPLCRMLAIELPEAAGVAERPKRVRKPRAKVDWGRIPLPRGVMAAVRRQRLAEG